MASDVITAESQSPELPAEITVRLRSESLQQTFLCKLSQKDLQMIPHSGLQGKDIWCILAPS